MKRAFRIQIDLFKYFSKEESNDFLKKTFESREIEFICKPKDEYLDFLYYSDGEDKLQEIFITILKNKSNFKKVEINGS